MAHEYCMKCGEKNQFEVSPPKFCSSCGVSFNTGVTAKAKTTVQEEEKESHDSYNIRNLASDWVAESASSQFPTLGDILSNPVRKGDYGARPSQFAEMDPMDVVKQTVSECAPVREMKEVK